MIKLFVQVILLLSLFSFSYSSTLLEDNFVQWMRINKKQYSTSEETISRLKIYKENAAKVEKLNKLHPQTQFALNKFSDLTTEEFKAQYLNFRVPQHDPNAPVAPEYPPNVIKDLPESFDWRDKGAVTPVKDQGFCGSCWSFSATGNIEGRWFLAGNKLTRLSEQNLVDCDHECSPFFGEIGCDEGCNGGLQPNAFKYIIKNGGINTEESYPYKGYDGTCKFNNKTIGAKISNWTMISKNEDQMAAYMVQNGPIAIAADATLWQFYFGGVFYIPCTVELNHAILIVGYGTEYDIFGRLMPYWIVKNSWGSSWGSSGYIYIQRGVGKCGLNEYVCSAIV